MTVRRMNYLSLSADKRQKGIAKHQQALRDSLANPILTEQQRVDIQGRLLQTRLWVQGELETEIHPDEDVPADILKAREAKAAAEDERAKGLEEKLKAEKDKAEKSKNHDVDVDEDVPVDDGVN